MDFDLKTPRLAGTSTPRTMSMKVQRANSYLDDGDNNYAFMHKTIDDRKDDFSNFKVSFNLKEIQKKDQPCIFEYDNHSRILSADKSGFSEFYSVRSKELTES